MAKVMTTGYELLEPGIYTLEILSTELVEGSYNGEQTKQIKCELEVVGGERAGYTFFDYLNRDKDTGGIKPKTKAWDVFEACLRTKLAADEELDTDDIEGKQFMAQVVVKQTGTGNRTEHGTIGPVPRKRPQPAPEPETTPEDEEDFNSIPL